ncbi:hypothetical protein Tco_1534154, partial [Tanacetum coccineum]
MERVYIRLARLATYGLSMVRPGFRVKGLLGLSPNRGSTSQAIEDKDVISKMKEISSAFLTTKLNYD